MVLIPWCWAWLVSGEGLVVLNLLPGTRVELYDSAFATATVKTTDPPMTSPSGWRGGTPHGEFLP